MLDKQFKKETFKNSVRENVKFLYRKTLEEAGAAAYAQTPEKLGDMIIGD